MSSDISVSKGVFVSKNGFLCNKNRTKRRKKDDSIFSNHLWYRAFSSQWRDIETKLRVINSEMFSTTLKDLVKFVHISCEQKIDDIPTAALLTGINMPDHEEQFSTLSKELKENVSPHCVTLQGQDCQNFKHLVEHMINGFVNDEDADLDDLYNDRQDQDSIYIKKSQCTFSVLQAWYESLYMNTSLLNYSGTSSSKKQKTVANRKVLVVIIPELENCNEAVIQDFILIAHSYLNILPFFLIFGVATSLNALHKALPYHVSSKTNIKVFSSQPSTVYLNNVLENVFFTEHCPFSLGGMVFSLFTDLFLFYDLSVTGFVKNYKYAMMEHFSQGNFTALCCNKNIENIFDQFTHEDFESIRKLNSFRDLVEMEVSFKKRIQLLTDNIYLKKIVLEKVSILQDYRNLLHIFLRCLQSLVKDLPKTPLGKQIRELYGTVTTKNISKSPHFKECFQLLNFQSKDNLYVKLKNMIEIIENNSSSNEAVLQKLEVVKKKLELFLKELKTSGTNVNSTDSKKTEEVPIDNAVNRKQFKENLMKMSHPQSKNEYEKLRQNIVEYLRSVFEKYLVEYSTFHLYEIFFFNDISIQNQLIGVHRSAIHTALTDPQTYLQCSCCEIQNEGAILSTMPDMSIAYKLHLECGKMINLYDWLQAFLSVLDPIEEDDETKRRVDPELQARFTQAIVELEYLGFIKTSKRKTDHVQRLTWGG